MAEQSGNEHKQDIDTDILIIGTGFGGLGMAIKLKEAGLSNFVITEKASAVGGCWRENSYPGAACDVPSHLYSFSFEPKSDWSRRFAPQAEIYSYLNHCTDKYALDQHIQFNTEIASAEFSQIEGCWHLESTDRVQIRARIVISACGQLSRPAIPTLPGIDKFTGKQMHSAHWDHQHELTGKRVAVIGTGASAIQLVPEIAESVANMAVFQRSAPYIISKPDRLYSSAEKTLFKHVPIALKLSRALIYLQHEVRMLGFTWFKPAMKIVEKSCARKVRKTVKDPSTQKKLVPNYPAGCKRLLISNNYLATFNRENVDLVTDAISTVDKNGIHTKNGHYFPVDTIIYGTGFKATEFLSPMSIRGIGGKDLNEAWKDGAESYLGITVNDFPNFYMLYGPNTNLGHNSIIYMLESQIQFVMQNIRLIFDNNLRFSNTREAAQAAYNQRVQARVRKTIWEKGCNSWYKTQDGKNTNNWPDFTFKYKKMTRTLNTKDFELADFS